MRVLLLINKQSLRPKFQGDLNVVFNFIHGMQNIPSITFNLSDNQKHIQILHVALQTVSLTDGSGYISSTQSETVMLTRPLFKGFLFLTVIYFTALLGTIVIMGPTLVLLWIRPKWFRWVNDRLMVIWLGLPPVSLTNDICLYFFSFVFPTDYVF